jgi:putative dimethyl sulfoxide reductase chaperone
MTLMSEQPVSPDLAFAEALAQLSSNAQVRLAGWRLCARLLSDAPTLAFLSELRETRAVDSLATLAENSVSSSAGAFRSLATWLARADDAALEEARREGQALFVATRHLPAPPWESVYTSPERLVLQDAARDALAAYAEAGFIFDGWKSTPADHISLELDFAATLLAQSISDAKATERLARFEQRHFAWMPRFCKDLSAAAKSPLYLHLADALAALVTVPDKR